MTLTLGMLANQKQLGPYTLSYLGRANSAGAVTSLTQNFNLGTEYRNRLVFVGVVRQVFATTSSSVTVGGKACTKIGGITSGGVTEWWYVASDIGTTSVPVVANFSDSYDSSFYVYVLGGGALGGTTPTLEVQNGYQNNSNAVNASFAASTVNDYFLAVGMKANGGPSAMGGFNSNMSPLTNNATGQQIGTSGSSSSVCSVGLTGAVTSAYIQATGFDGSKGIQLTAVRIRKA